MRQSTAFVAGQSDCWSTACNDIPTSWPLGYVLGRMQENSSVIPHKSVGTPGDLDPYLVHNSLDLPKSTFQTVSGSVELFLQDCGRYRQIPTDRLLLSL